MILPNLVITSMYDFGRTLREYPLGYTIYILVDSTVYSEFERFKTIKTIMIMP